MKMINIILLAIIVNPVYASLGDRLTDGSPLFVVFVIGVVGLLISRRKLRH